MLDTEAQVSSAPAGKLQGIPIIGDELGENTVHEIVRGLIYLEGNGVTDFFSGKRDEL